MYSLKSGSVQRDKDEDSPRILHILLVENHDDTRRAIKLFLQALGHRTQVAVGVQEALNLAATSNTRFDLLLSDIRLPDGTGWELLRRLKETDRRPKQAIAISAWGTKIDLAESKSAAFRVHLVKPIAPEVLETALGQAAAAICEKKD